MVVVFDGMNGTGKSSVISALAGAKARFGNKTIPVHVHRMPGHDTELSNLFRELLVEKTDPRAPDCVWTRRALYLADAAEYWQKNRALCESKEHLVLLDRCHHSTLAYGMLGGLHAASLKALMQVSNMACPLQPDLYLYMTTDAETSVKRTTGRAEKNKDVSLDDVEQMEVVARCYGYTVDMLPWNMMVHVNTEPLTFAQVVALCKTQIWQTIGVFLETSTAQGRTTT